VKTLDDEIEIEILKRDIEKLDKKIEKVNQEYRDEIHEIHDAFFTICDKIKIIQPLLDEYAISKKNKNDSYRGESFYG